MKAPSVNVGWGAVLALAAVAAVYYIFKKGAGVLSTAYNAAETSVLDSVTTDQNASVQSNFQKFLAAWKAAGSPAAGSSAETALRLHYGIPLAPNAQLAAAAAGGSHSGGGGS